VLAANFTDMRKRTDCQDHLVHPNHVFRPSCHPWYGSDHLRVVLVPVLAVVLGVAIVDVHWL
jgi:hypothetical protein